MKWPGLRRVRLRPPGWDMAAIFACKQCGEHLYYVEVGDLEFIECLTCGIRHEVPQ